MAHLRPQGLHPLLMLVDSDEEREKLVPELRQEQVSGVLLISLHPEDPLPHLLTGAGAPHGTVLVAGPPGAGLLRRRRPPGRRPARGGQARLARLPTGRDDRGPGGHSA
ncbi:hypothetical protein [Amycolatopsis sp. lyj-346]|uniref:hypothetical protein n=1 Tax=Amycolatopsis sp. lyj-346 TaxID=2789289 RepID=UPI00397DAC52